MSPFLRKPPMHSASVAGTSNSHQAHKGLCQFAGSTGVSGDDGRCGEHGILLRTETDFCTQLVSQCLPGLTSSLPSTPTAVISTLWVRHPALLLFASLLEIYKKKGLNTRCSKPNEGSLAQKPVKRARSRHVSAQKVQADLSNINV